MENQNKQEVKNNSIVSEFVPYEQALALKELGFDEPCIMQWTYAPELIFCTSAWGHPKLKTNKESYSDSGGDCISAPTFSQAFRWFREKHGLFVAPCTITYNSEPYLWCFEINSTDLPFGTDLGETDDFKTYEEAELACLKKLIQIVKEKQL